MSNVQTNENEKNRLLSEQIAVLVENLPKSFALDVTIRFSLS